MALGIGVFAGVLAMRRADLRARRTLYQTLGYGDDLIARLSAQKGPVSAQLTLTRNSAIISSSRIEELRDHAGGLQGEVQPVCRHTRAFNGTRSGHERSTAAARRGSPTQ